MKKIYSSNSNLIEFLSSNGIEFHRINPSDDYVLISDEDAEELGASYNIEDFSLSDYSAAIGKNAVWVTSGRNGYPENLRHAIIGFDNYDEARKLAQRLNADVVLLHKQNGWDLWEIGLSCVFDAIRTNYDNYCTNGQMYRTLDEVQEDQDYWAQCLYEDIEDEDELASAIADNDARFERIKNWVKEYVLLNNNDYIVVNECGDFVTAAKDYVMYDTYDVHHYVIGVMYA